MHCVIPQTNLWMSASGSRISSSPCTLSDSDIIQDGPCYICVVPLARVSIHAAIETPIRPESREIAVLTRIGFRHLKRHQSVIRQRILVIFGLIAGNLSERRCGFGWQRRHHTYSHLSDERRLASG